MKYSRITGTGSYLPDKVLSNHEIAESLETSNEWIIDRTGIESRHIAADDETTASMAEQAAIKALQAANITVSQIDLIIIATCTPDRFFPSTACLLQQRLGIDKTIIAFDVSAACAGFIYALSVADSLFKTTQVQTALVIGSEVMSRVLNWKDRRTCILFGDGAGAVVLQAAEGPGIIGTHLCAYAEYADLLTLPNPIAAPYHYQDAHIDMVGREVFKIAVHSLGQCIVDVLHNNDMSLDDVDWFIPHQANDRIIQSAAKKLSIPMKKMISTVRKHGNTSSASIPLALDLKVREGEIKPGDTLVLEGFGGGMTWGSVLLRL